MTEDFEARAPATPMDATVTRPQRIDPPAGDASRGGPGDAGSDREYDALPRCCEGWIAEQVHTQAQSRPVAKPRSPTRDFC